MTIIPNRMVYCPYTDREIPESESSPEHIIPLSLGGGSKSPSNQKCDESIPIWPRA